MFDKNKLTIGLILYFIFLSFSFAKENYYEEEREMEEDIEILQELDH